MIRIKRLYDRKQTTFIVYTKDEADENNFNYVHWKQADTGDFAITDDEYVMKCLGRKSYTDKNGNVKTFIRLSGGVGWDNNASKIFFKKNHQYECYTKTNPARTWEEVEINSTRGKNTIAAYAHMMLNGEVDFSTLGNIYRPKDQIPEATVRRFLKKTKVKHAVEKKVQEILSDKAVNKEFAIDNIANIIPALK